MVSTIFTVMSEVGSTLSLTTQCTGVRSLCRPCPAYDSQPAAANQECSELVHNDIKYVIYFKSLSKR